MTDLLRPQLRNLYNALSPQKQSKVASFGTPVQKRKEPEEKLRYSTPQGRYEVASSKTTLPNYTAEYATNAPVFGTPSKNSQGEGKKIWDSPSTKPRFLPEKSLQHQHMNTLVLDMDETILHASTVPTTKPDLIVRLSDGVRFYVLKRPHVDEFLERMSKIYEIVIYTSGEREYATSLINHVDPNGYISHILHRDHCIYTRNGFDKDLSYIGRDLKGVVFIDNLEENLRRQKENGIKILDFYSNKRDEELKKLIPFLEYAATLEDVRPINKVYADFLVRGLQNPHNIKPKQKQGPPPSQHSPRRCSVFGEEVHKKSRFAQMRGDSVETEKRSETYYTARDTKNPEEKLNENGLPQTKLLLSEKTVSKSIFFVGRSDEKAHLLKAERPAFHHGDLGSPKMGTSGFESENSRTNTSGSESTMSEVVMRYETQNRINFEKGTIKHTREVEVGTLVEKRNNSILKEKPLNIAERPSVLGELYEKINALEQRLKNAKALSDSVKA